MRFLTAGLCLVALVQAGCHCGSNLVGARSELEVQRPTEKLDDTTWVLPLGEIALGAEGTGLIAIGNRGKISGAVTSVKVRDGFDRDVRVEPLTLPAQVIAGAGVELTVVAAPLELGPFESFVDVTTDDPALPSFTVKITYSGVTVPEVHPADCHLRALPAALDFGDVPQTGFGEMHVVVESFGMQACKVMSIATLGSAAFTLLDAPHAPLTLLPKGTATLKVRYAPSPGIAMGTETGQLELRSDDDQSPLLVPLTANVVAPKSCDLHIVPKPLAFGKVGLGATVPLPFDVWNFGTGGCPFVKARMEPGSSGDLSVVLTPTALNAREKQSGTVYFTPSHPGPAAGTLFAFATPGFTSAITSSDTAPVSGVGAAGRLCVVPPVLDFGTVAPGDTKDMTFTISSCGDAIAAVRAVMLDPGTAAAFTLTPPATPLTLAPGATVTASVRYAPTAGGPHAGSATVLGNDNPVVSLRGNVPATCTRLISCAPVQVTFAHVNAGDHSLQTFECRNVGSANVNLIDVRRATGTPADFGVVAGTLPVTLAAGESVRVTIDFHPSSAGALAGAIEIVHDGCGPMVRVDVAGTGTVPNFPVCTHATMFTPVTKWQYTSPSVLPKSDKVSALPVVINLDDDNGDGRVNEDDIPDVVFSTYDLGQSFGPGAPAGAPLRAVRGSDGTALWTVTDPDLRVRWNTQPAAADLDGDGRPEIIAVQENTLPGDAAGHGKFTTGRLVAFSSGGKLEWLSEWWHRSALDTEDLSGIAIGDLDGDGKPEIVLGASVFDWRGRLLWEGAGNTGSASGFGPISTLADLDDDGRLEVIGGNTVYRADGSVWWRYLTPPAFDVDAHSAVADLDGDGKPEVVLRTKLTDFVVLSADGVVKHAFSIPGQATACAAPFTIADFDGDGLPEIAAPFGDMFKMFEADGTVRWSMPIVDYGGQCGAAGPSAFDFDGDGTFEVVYNDTAHLFVFRGSTGLVIYDEPRSSQTLYEIPVIADVDRDGHADLIVSNWDSPGLKVMSNLGNDWAAAPPIWNQHTFHVTNISPSGVVPRHEGAGWRRFNAFRATKASCRP